MYVSRLNKGVLLAVLELCRVYCFAVDEPVMPKLSFPKSDLVKKIEAIVADPLFAKIPKKVFSAEGVVADDKTINTKAIQSAIDTANKAGGGVVTLPKGTSLSGALFMKSNVELRLDEGVVLKAVNVDAEYPETRTRVAGIEMNWPAALINIDNARNVRVSGKGIVDGNGKYWWNKFWGDPKKSGGMFSDYMKRNLRWALDYDCKRVRPLVVYKSENVRLENFTVQRAGFWTITLTFSRRIHVDGIVIRNNIGGHGPSTDGINVDSSQDVLIENCDVECNDDNFCLKAGRDSDGLRVNIPTANVVIRNCKTGPGLGLFTIGSETSGGFHDIEVSGLVAKGTWNGFSVKSAKIRGGVLRNIWFHHVEMEGVGNPFTWELDWFPLVSYPPRPEHIPESEWPAHWRVLLTKVEPPERGIPEFHDIRISNVTAKHAKRAIYANAYPEKPLWGVHWENVTIEAESAGSLNNCKDWTMNDVVLRVDNMDQLSLLGCTNVPAPALTKRIRNAQ